ncbi:MAG: cyclase family protein [Methanohalobium sp.]|uniref:cyclase family protein n=1 Tax=Methanohalobium sp. TaxID=2837493 RepID=UPI00397A7A8B
MFGNKKTNEVIDISVSISSLTPVYPGDPAPDIKKIFCLPDDGASVSSISMGSHTGTHIDAPSHIFKDGKSVDKLSLDTLVGNAVLLDLSSIKETIKNQDLENAFNNIDITDNVEILLIKTQNSKIWTDPSSMGFESMISLDISAGHWIVKNGFKSVGIDGFSVDVEPDLEVHRLLLGNEIGIIECLNFNRVSDGVYSFVCLPLKMKGCDGSPARAILIKSQ